MTQGKDRITTEQSEGWNESSEEWNAGGSDGRNEGSDGRNAKDSNERDGGSGGVRMELESRERGDCVVAELRVGGGRRGPDSCV